MAMRVEPPKPAKFRRQVLRLIKQRYSGSEEERFGPTLAAEHLAEEDGMVIDHEALVKKVVFDEVQRFPTNSTMQRRACVKLEKVRTEDVHGGCGIARECS